MKIEMTWKPVEVEGIYLAEMPNDIGAPVRFLKNFKKSEDLEYPFVARSVDTIDVFYPKVKKCKSTPGDNASLQPTTEKG